METDTQTIKSNDNISHTNSKSNNNNKTNTSTKNNLNVSKLLSDKRKKNAELYYAFNIEEKKRRGLPSQKLNFENINRNFYDELIEHDDELKQYKKNLKINKSAGIKELIYSNRRIPEIWRQKISYIDDLYSTMSEDRKFIAYLGRGNEHEAKEKEESQNIKQQTLLDNDKYYISKNISTESSAFTSPSYSRPLSPGKTFTKTKKAYGRFVNMITDYQEINNLLDDYRMKYPLELPNQNKLKVLLTETTEEPKMKLPSITETNEHNSTNNNKDDNNNTKVLSIHSQTNSKSQTNTKNKFDIIPGINKSKFFRTTMYSQLIPETTTTKRERHRTEINLSPYNTNTNNISPSHKKPKHNLTRNAFSPGYLHGSHEDFVRLLPIYNPKVKEKLKSINNFGPHYSHCPPCQNKNIDFYNRLETNQCMKLLTYLRSIRNPKNGINIPSSNKQPSLNESLPSYQILSSLKTYITKTFPKETAVYFTNMYDISSSIQEYITNISTLYLNTNTSWAMSVSKSQTSGETHSQVIDAFESLIMRCLYKQIFNLIGTDSKLNRIILKYSFLNLNHFGISYPNIQKFFDFNKQVSMFSEIDDAITPKEKLRYICNICRYIIKIFGEGNLNKCLMFVILHCGVNNLKSHIRYVFLFRNKVLLSEDEEVYLDSFLKAFDVICNLKVMYKEILEISEEEFVSKSERFDMKEIIEGLILENGTFKNNYFLDDRLLALVNSEKRKNAEKGKEEKIVIWKDENGVPNLKELISKYKDIDVGKLSISELNELKIIFEKLIDIIVTIHNESKVIE